MSTIKNEIKFTIPEGYSLEVSDDLAYSASHQEAWWYCEGGSPYKVATLRRGNDYATIYCLGEMRLEYKEFSLRDTSAIWKETNFSGDRELNQAIENGEIVVENNPWFEVEINGNLNEWGEVCHTIEEALACAIETLKADICDICGEYHGEEWDI